MKDDHGERGKDDHGDQDDQVDHDGLKVLEAAREYALQMAAIARRLPRHAPSKLRADLIETSRAIGASIAEGFGRRTTGEKLHYSRNAYGSLEESQEHLRECINSHLIDRKTFYPPWNRSVAIAKCWTP